MISADPHHNPADLSHAQMRHAEDMILEPNEARLRLAVLQMRHVAAPENLQVLEHALFLEEGGQKRASIIACLSEPIRDLQTRLK